MFYKKKKIAVIGSTGSIGTSALNIIKKNLNLFNIELLVCDKSYKSLVRQVNLFSPKYVYINDLDAKKKFIKLNFSKKTKLINHVKDFEKFFKKNKIDKTILAVSSVQGLRYTFNFLKFSREILIANKESIVCGGNLLLKRAKLLKCKITSIDSELYSLSQLILNKKFNIKKIDSVYLTASGGPFLGKCKKNFYKSPISKVISHPKWSMGEKISVDSATMVNKIFEIIETHVLFKIPINKIKIKIHKESLVHCVVIFKDGFVNAAMHNTSMEIPIRNSLIKNVSVKQTDNFFKNTGNINLNFNEEQLLEFPILKKGLKILKYGQSAWILLNIFNDCLVKNFLDKKIFYHQIVDNLIELLNNKSILAYCKNKVSSLDDIEKTINFGLNQLAKLGKLGKLGKL